MSAETFSKERAEAFGEKMVGTLNGAAIALMTSIGHRTGLFDTMAGMSPAPPETIAAESGLQERYVREWLGAMVTGGIIDHEPGLNTFHLPPEHAALVTRAAGADNIASSMQWIAVLGGVEDDVTEVFRSGGGVPYSRYPRFHEVMAEESNQTVVAGLREHILPLVPGLTERLESGIDVLDVGCGRGRALQLLAKSFPRSRFTGYDFSEEAVKVARQEAAAQGLSNLHFAVRDAGHFHETASYDLITAFDAIHDQIRPDLVLANIARALRPGGTFLMQDIQASGHVHGDRDYMLAPFVYTISCMHCMTVSLSNGGMGLGAAWGKERALSLMADAGFGDVRVETLPHDIINYYYLAEAPARVRLMGLETEQRELAAAA